MPVWKSASRSSNSPHDSCAQRKSFWTLLKYAAVWTYSPGLKTLYSLSSTSMYNSNTLTKEIRMPLRNRKNTIQVPTIMLGFIYIEDI